MRFNAVILFVGILMSDDGAAGFARPPLPPPAGAASSSAASTAAGSSAASTLFSHPPSRSSASPAVLGLRGGMQEGDVSDWGPADVCHTYDLSRLVADCPPNQVLQPPFPVHSPQQQLCALSHNALLLVRASACRCVRLHACARLRVCVRSGGGLALKEGNVGGVGKLRQGTDEGPALILVNYELPRALMERLWFNATLRVCADGAINRLYAAFDSGVWCP